jgi:hypothetical protein
MSKHNVFMCLPSARGVHPDTVWNIFNMRTEIEKAGSFMHGASVYRMPLDLARNEMMTAFLSTTADLALLQDDDVQIEAPWIVKMMGAIDAGCDIVTAPCRMRGGQNLFNIVPVSDPLDMGGVSVIECAWTGLGSVLVHRRVLEKLHADALERSKKPPCPTCGHKDSEAYRSHIMPERTSSAIFRSQVEPARRFFLESPEELNLYLLDDRVFSLKAVEAGFKIHAAIDVPTIHDGMTGCFSAVLAEFERARLEEQQRDQKRRPSLLGADGKPLGK